uniref:Uncharacterized protein n=1 Tax=Anguilla anguilla TaxID=7936 RepID=A0A0E9Y2N8_ANGAN
MVEGILEGPSIGHYRILWSLGQKLHRSSCTDIQPSRCAYMYLFANL